MRFLNELLQNRIEDISSESRQSNGEYARAFFKRKELYAEIDEIISRDKQIALDTSDYALFKDFFEKDFKVHANWEQALYKQGYIDCIRMLRDVGVIR